MLAPEKMTFYFLKCCFLLETSLLPWEPQPVSLVGSFHAPNPCVNREVCFRLCQRGLVGSCHTLGRLAKVSVGAERGEVAGSDQGIGSARPRDVCSARFGVSPHNQCR